MMRTTAALLFLLLAFPGGSSAKQSLDFNFGARGAALFPSPLGGQVAVGYAIREDTSGRLVMSGVISDAKGKSRMAVWRMNGRGRLDESFGEGGIFYSQDDDWAWSMDFDERGRIVLGGIEGGNWRESKHGVARRVLENGKPDPSFGTNGSTRVASPDGTRARVFAAKTAPGSKIYLAGVIVDAAGRSKAAVWRLTQDGKLDPDFGRDGLVVLPSGASRREIQTDALMLEGDSIFVSGTIDWKHLALWKLDLRGTPDPGFSGRGLSSTLEGIGRGIARDERGRLYVGGFKYTYQGDTVIEESAILTRFELAGTPDPSFGENGELTLPHSDEFPSHESFALLRSPSRRIYLAGYADHGGGIGLHRDPKSISAAFWSFSPEGRLEKDFGANGIWTLPSASGGKEDRVYALASDAHGRVVACGFSRDASGKMRSAVWRF